jgi:GTP-binding protein
VGKSSLLNSLLGVRGLARASSTPGRTQSLNFFLINGKFRFVDLPGYGYARAPRAVQAEWGLAAAEYLAKREQLVLSIHIVDSRHEPSKQDLQLHEWLEHNHKPHLIVITKSDKLSRNELAKSVNRAAQIFPNTDLIAYSSTKRQGREQLWSAIEKSLKG